MNFPSHLPKEAFLAFVTRNTDFSIPKAWNMAVHELCTDHRISGWTAAFSSSTKWSRVHSTAAGPRTKFLPSVRQITSLPKHQTPIETPSTGCLLSSEASLLKHIHSSSEGHSCNSFLPPDICPPGWGTVPSQGPNLRHPKGIQYDFTNSSHTMT